MRIISGLYKGRRFQLPKGLMARPTTDFAKEGLFNLLNNRLDFEGLRMLDLFSGTGSISLECLSRGAEQITCVEQYPLHAHFIRSVAQQLKATNLQVIQGDVFTWLQRPTGSYDLIFADPPYAEPRLESLPDRILSTSLLAEDGILVLEHSKKNDFSKHPRFSELRRYGNVHFSFFRGMAPL